MRRSEEEIAVLAAKFKSMTRGAEVKALRSRLSDEDARRVIGHSVLDPLDRRVLSFMSRFGADVVETDERTLADLTAEPNGSGRRESAGGHSGADPC